MTTPPDSRGPDPLQFDSAAPAGNAAGALVCAQCQQPIRAYYYEIAGQIVDARCKALIAQKIGIGVDASAGTVARALVFGGLAAAAGAALYLAIAVFAHVEIALIAILVGWMVGKAVRHGSNGRGGKRYQIIAVALTYFAISVSYVPAMLATEFPELAAADSTAPNKRVARAADDTSAVASSQTARDRAADRTESTGYTIAAFTIGLLVLLVIAPIKVVLTDFPQSAISVLIIGLGLMQAWRSNKRANVEFKGPFKVATPAPAAGVND